MGIVFGLCAALLWGGGDFLINRLTTVVGTVRALAVTQAMSLVCWLAVGLATGLPAAATAGFVGTALVCGVFHVLGLVLTYRAFEVGTLSLVSPIASSFAIVTAVLALASGERPGGPALTGAFLLVVGVAVVTRGSSNGEASTLRGVPEALGSAVSFGVMFWLIEGVTKAMGMAWPLVVLKVMAVASAVGTYALKRPPADERRPKLTLRDGLVLGGGVAVSDTLAWGAWIVGTRTSYNTVVTALASLFSVVTVLLAAVFLKERLNRYQALGVGIVLGGILLVSL